MLQKNEQLNGIIADEDIMLLHIIVILHILNYYDPFEFRRRMELGKKVAFLLWVLQAEKAEPATRWQPLKMSGKPYLKWISHCMYTIIHVKL